MFLHMLYRDNSQVQVEFRQCENKNIREKK